MEPKRDWGWFLAWAGAGALLALTVLGAFSIGPFVLPLVLVSLWAIARRSPPWPTAFGFSSGLGLMCVVVWALNRGSGPCPEGELVLPPGHGPVECTDFDPLPFLVAGIVLILAGPLLFTLARRRDRPARLG